MSKKVVEVKTLKVGKYVIFDGEASKITSISTSSPGKHGAAACFQQRINQRPSRHDSGLFLPKSLGGCA